MELFSLPLPVIFIGSLVAILGVGEAGYWIGRRAGPKGHGNVSVMESAALGLLALMIGFTFAMALARFDERRQAVVEEANAIGTAALRARLLPAPHAHDSIALFRDYVEVRLALTRKVATMEDLWAGIARSSEIQEQLWQQVRAVAAKDAGMVPTGLYIQALNEMIDNQEKRIAAVMNRIPPIVLFALYGIAAVSAGFTGYGSGLARERSRLPRCVTGIVVAGVILLIQDLDRPGAGFIRVSQMPMIHVSESLAGYNE
ncbi:MAG: hypothetical protein AB7M05_19985 [Alphaproteobacteria bacterium]